MFKQRQTLKVPDVYHDARMKVASVGREHRHHSNKSLWLGREVPS